MKMIRLCGLWLAICLTVSVSAQIDFDNTFPTGDLGKLGVCGPDITHEATLENQGADEVTGLEVQLDLPDGIDYRPGSVTGPGVTEITADPPVFSIPTLASGATLDVDYDLFITCEDGLDLSNDDADKTYNYIYNHDSIPAPETVQSAPFEVTKPQLSIPRVRGNVFQNLNVFDGYLGLEDELEVDIVNGGNGLLTEFTYLVVNNNTALTFRELHVNGVNVPLAGTSGDTLFYTLDADEIANAAPFAGNATNDPDIFQFNETLTVEELWEVTNCDFSAPDLERGVRWGCDVGAQYGCDDNNADPDNITPIRSGVRFNQQRPNIFIREYGREIFTRTVDTRTAEYDFFPECYNDPTEDVSTDRLVFYNTGDAPGLVENFNLNQSSLAHFGIDTSSFVIYEIDPNDGTALSAPQRIYLQSATYSSPNGGSGCPIYKNRAAPRTVRFRDLGWQIDAGQYFMLEFKRPYLGTDGSTGGPDGDACNSCSDSQNRFARPGISTTSKRYTDLCGANARSMNGGTIREFDVFIREFPEGPSNLSDGQMACYNYSVDSYFNSFMNIWYCPTDNGRLNNPNNAAERNTYPLCDDCYLEFVYTIGEGLDWTGTSGDLMNDDLVWTDGDGDILRPIFVDYTDNNGGDDVLTVRYPRVDHTEVCFDPRRNSAIKLNTVADCAETGPMCSQGGPISIVKDSYFILDPSCPGSCREVINERENINLELDCPSCDPCDGITYTGLTFERQTVGRGDNDNDGRAEAGETIDDTKINRQRFMSGDTIKATFRGFVQANTIASFAHLYTLIDLPAAFDDLNVPLGARVKIYDVSQSAGNQLILETDLVRQFFNNGQDQLVTDLSPDNLASLGNMIDPNFEYAAGDSVVVETFFKVTKRPISTAAQYDFNTEFFTKTTPFGSGTRYQCNNLDGRMTYVGYSGSVSFSNETIGGCRDCNANGYMTMLFRAGSENLDYFPFEVRQLAKPTQTIFNNDSDLTWGGTLCFKYRDANGSFDTNGTRGDRTYNNLAFDDYAGIVQLDERRVLVNWETLFDELGIERCDEGFRLQGFPSLSPSCQAEFNPPSTPKQVSFVNTIDFDASVIGTPQLELAYDYVNAAPNTPILEHREVKLPGFENADPTSTTGTWIAGSSTPSNSGTGNNRLALTGQPEIIVQTAQTTQEIRQENVCFRVDLVNQGSVAASNAYLFFESPSNAVIFQSAKDANGNDLPNNLGIVPVGNLAAGGTAQVELCITSNNCSRDSLIVYGGWDCTEVPATPEEARCSTPTTLFFEPVDALLGMVVEAPDPSVVQQRDLCGEVEYVVRLSSGDLGHLSRIRFRFRLPNGQDFVPGSFAYSYPADLSDPSGGNNNYVAYATQPENTSGNNWEMDDLLTEPPVLMDEGLVGTTDVTRNFFLVRFRTTLGCGYTSGARVRFQSTGYNVCDQITNRQFSPGPRVRITNQPIVYLSSFDPTDDISLEACPGESRRLDVRFGISATSPPLTPNDSLIITLPPGLTYQPNSYVPVKNSVSTPPLVTTVNGSQVLFIDLVDGLMGGNNVRFFLNVESTDVGQDCGPQDIVLQTFSARSTTCVATGEVCQTRALSDETTITVTVNKPELTATNFSATATPQPPGQDRFEYCFDLSNMGSNLPAGVTTTVQFYDDVNNNGDVDEGTDVLLTEVTSMESIANGQTRQICGVTDVPSGRNCAVIAYISPEATCSCLPSETFPVRVERIYGLDTLNLEVCNGETIQDLGPGALDRVEFFWIGLDGASTAPFATPNASPSDYTGSNPSDQTSTFRYALRSVNDERCATFDTLTIDVFPTMRGMVTTQACLNDTFQLAGPLGNTDYVWTAPNGGLIDPNEPLTEVLPSNYPAGTYLFTLDYTDVNGCAAVFEQTVTIVNCAPQTSVSSKIWCDTDQDGINDPEEQALVGIPINLYAANDLTTPLNSRITDANGAVQFIPLPAGNYSVGVPYLLADGYRGTTPNQGTIDSLDSELDPTTLSSFPFFLGAGDSLTHIDLGVFCPLVDLDLEKDVFSDRNGAPYEPSGITDTVFYRLRVCNRMFQGDSVQFAARNVVVNDDLSDKLKFIAAYPSTGTYDATTGDWTIPEIATNGCAELYLETELLDKPDEITNTVTFESSEFEEGYTPPQDRSVTLQAVARDYGDLSDNGTTAAGSYRTLDARQGASHRIVAGLRIGNLLDAEADGQPDAAALGDDDNNNGNTDDEDGVALPDRIIPGQLDSMTVEVVNTTGEDAFLYVWIDWNNDGTFDEFAERVVTDRIATSQTETYQFTIPESAAEDVFVGVRARLSHQSNMMSFEDVGSGEVEDYLIYLSPCAPKTAGGVQILGNSR